MGSAATLSHLLTRAVLDREIAGIVGRAQGLAGAIGIEPFFEHPHDQAERTRLGREVERHRALVPDLLRVKVWALDATILWSDEPELVDQKFPENQSLHRAATGQIVASVKQLTHAGREGREREHFWEAEHRSLIEVYTPVHSRRGSTLGVIEVYARAELLDSMIWSVRLASFGASLGACLVCWALSIALARVTYGRRPVAGAAGREPEVRGLLGLEPGGAGREC